MLRDGPEPSTPLRREEEGSIKDASAEVKHTQRNGSTPDQRAAQLYANRRAEILQDEERAALLRQLDVLAGLMSCFAAMDQRERQFKAPTRRRMVRNHGIAEHWVPRKRDAA